MTFIINIVLENFKNYPVWGLFTTTSLFVVGAWVCYYYNKIKLTYFLVAILFLNVSLAVYFQFYNFSNEELSLFIVWYLGFFSLIFYTSHKIVSFFFLYATLYVLFFYCIYNIESISSTFFSYAFYLSLFFLYHYYFTFSQRFLLRAYSIIRTFLKTEAFLKLNLWVVFILFPSLVNNIFIFFLVFNQLLVLALVANHHIILAFLSLLWIWFCFLSISNYFKLFPKIRKKILKYFSRKACLHFVGNSLGAKLQPHLPAILIALVATIPAIAGPINDATTNANTAGDQALKNYMLKHPNQNLSPAKQQEIFNEGFFGNLINNKHATFVHRITNGKICQPRLVDGNTILYTDPHHVGEARKLLPPIDVLSDQKSLEQLQERYVENLNSLRQSIRENPERLKQELLSKGLKTDSNSVQTAEDLLLENLTKDTNRLMDDYYRERGVERKTYVQYDSSDQSFSSIDPLIERDGDSHTSSLSSNASDEFDPQKVKNWTSDQPK